jgi:hypothetical protein
LKKEKDKNQASVTHFWKKKKLQNFDEFVNLKSLDSQILSMADPAGPGESGTGPGGVQEKPSEDNIRVVCRFRPLNTQEERTNSKFVVKFPDDQCASVSVSFFTSYFCVNL